MKEKKPWYIKENPYQELGGGNIPSKILLEDKKVRDNYMKFVRKIRIKKEESLGFSDELINFKTESL